jgi:hypothetical protein
LTDFVRQLTLDGEVVVEGKQLQCSKLTKLTREGTDQFVGLYEGKNALCQLPVNSNM